MTTTPDVARAEELIDALFEGAFESEDQHPTMAGARKMDAARAALLSFVRDLARERDHLRDAWLETEGISAGGLLEPTAAGVARLVADLSRLREQALSLVAECEGREIPFDLHDQIRALRYVAIAPASSVPGDPVADPVAALQAIDEHIARTGAAPLIAPAEQPIVCPRCKVKNWDRKAAEAHARWCAAPSPGAQGEEDGRG